MSSSPSKHCLLPCAAFECVPFQSANTSFHLHRHCSSYTSIRNLGNVFLVMGQCLELPSNKDSSTLDSSSDTPTDSPAGVSAGAVVGNLKSAAVVLYDRSIAHHIQSLALMRQLQVWHMCLSDLLSGGPNRCFVVSQKQYRFPFYGCVCLWTVLPQLCPCYITPIGVLSV